MAHVERQICCCGAGGWTKVIGWLELIISLLSIIALAFLAVAAIAATGSIDNVPARDGESGGEDDAAASKIMIIIFAVVLCVALAFLILGFVMAIILLKGSYNSNPKQIHYWMIYTYVFLVLYTLGYIIKCFKAESGAEVGSIVFNLIITLCIQGFFLWVVGIHKKEIEASSRHPVPI